MEKAGVTEKLLSRQQDITAELVSKRFALEDLTTEMRFLVCEYSRIQQQLRHLGVS